MLLATTINANVDVTQNIRALYKGVKLNETQKDYILDNSDENIEILEKILNKEVKKLKTKYLDEKNIISFKLKPNGDIRAIKFLKRSDNRKLDKATKKAIKKASKLFIKPDEETEIRYIMYYQIGSSQNVTNTYANNTSNVNTTNNLQPNDKIILKGTTRFEHDSKEYVRVFETSHDGFINANTSPADCATVKLLTNKNQKVRTGYTPWTFNVEVPKGKYKLLIKTKKTCDVSLQYL